MSHFDASLQPFTWFCVECLSDEGSVIGSVLEVRFTIYRESVTNIVMNLIVWWIWFGWQYIDIFWWFFFASMAFFCSRYWLWMYDYLIWDIVNNHHKQNQYPLFFWFVTFYMSRSWFSGWKPFWDQAYWRAPPPHGGPLDLSSMAPTTWYMIPTWGASRRHMGWCHWCHPVMCRPS